MLEEIKQEVQHLNHEELRKLYQHIAERLVLLEKRERLAKALNSCR